LIFPKWRAPGLIGGEQFSRVKKGKGEKDGESAKKLPSPESSSAPAYGVS